MTNLSTDARAVKSNDGRRSPVAILALVAFFLSIPLGALALYWLITMPDVTELAQANPRSTALIDARTAEARKRGRSIFPQQRWISLSRISSSLKRAVIVAEDARFYSHEGFDWEGIRDAALDNLEAGKFKRGGSTITQQLAKNLYLTPQKSLLRKVREALITRTLEHNLTKGRILELYLNVVEWGNHVYGAEAAARHHFGKSASVLTKEEAALLAAILPAPRLYDPLRVTKALRKKQERILEFMD